MSLSVISLPDECMHAGNEISCVIETSMPPSTDNLEILCGINVELVYGSGVYTTLIQQRLKPDDDGRCRFFWNQYLWDSFENQYDLPTPGGTSIFQLQNVVRRYTLFAIEYYGAPQTFQSIINTGSISQTRFAVKGAIPESRFAERGFFGSTGWNALNTASGGLGKSFLDWRGSNPITRTDEDQWLCFHWQDPTGLVGTAALDYAIRWRRSDGTSGEFIITTPVMQLNDVYALPAGFTQLGLSAFETSEHKIYEYLTSVRVNILGTPVQQSEVKTWSVDRDYYEFDFQLQYLNSLGVVEQFTVRGARITHADNEMNSVGTYRDSSYSKHDGESLVFDVLVKNGYTVFTGNLSQNQTKQLRDMKAGRKVWLLDGGRGQKNIPLRIGNTDTAIDEYTNQYQFELRLDQDFVDSVPDLF